jgi:hypothetical protein
MLLRSTTIHEKGVCAFLGEFKTPEKRKKSTRPSVWIHGGVTMNEAKQIHDELLNALLPIVVRTAYHDIRRLSTSFLGHCWRLPDPHRAIECVG